MPVEIGSYEAKTKLPEILRRVEAGEAFTITNRGRAVADVVPSKLNSQKLTQTAINNILAAKKHVVSDTDLVDLKESGRQ